MQGLVNFKTPLSQLPYKITGAQWSAVDNKLTINVNFYQSLADLQADATPLVQRSYFVPLSDTVFADQVNAYLKTSVESEGLFTLQPLGGA